MNDAVLKRDGRLQGILEEGFQQTLDLVHDEQRQLDVSLRQSEWLPGWTEDETLTHLEGLAPKLYKIIAKTMFRLIPIILESEVSRNEKVNLYFWGGYQSYLAKKRIFLKKQFQGTTWSLGVGILGSLSEEEFSSYDDCSQARWYHYMIPKRNTSKVRPEDLHKRLLRAPRRLKSLTVTTSPMITQLEGFSGHEVLSLAGVPSESWSWGTQLTTIVNEVIEGTGKRGKLTREMAQLRSLCSRMQAVWMHHIFCGGQPSWLNEFIDELLSRDETIGAGQALQSGLKDSRSESWEQPEPPFSSWTNISLHDWPAPSLSPAFDFGTSLALNGPEMAARTVGSAELLCSVPLGPHFVAIVRPWISAVYGLIRDTEISILAHCLQVKTAGATLTAGPYFAHELKKLLDEGLPTAIREIESTEPEAVSSRRFVLYSVLSISNLTYAFVNAVFSPDRQAAIEKAKRELLNPLRDLWRTRDLEAALRNVAMEVYWNVSRTDGARIEFGACPNQASLPITNSQYASCFFLTAEIVRTYAKYEPGASSTARWSAAVEGDLLSVRMKATTEAQRSPASDLARLHLFLRALDIGKVEVEWPDKEGGYTCVVQVNLGPMMEPDQQD